MADKDNRYWINRRAEMMYEQMDIAESAADRMSEQYYKVAKYIDNKLNDNFNRAVKKLNVSDKDIIDIINKAGSTSYNDILRAAKNKGLTELVEYLEEPGRKYRYERLIKQLDETNNAIDSLKTTGNQETTKALSDIAESTYYKSIYEIQSKVGLAFSFSEWDTKLFEKLALSNWSGKNYSNRIWDNTDALAETLKSELIQGFIAGKTQREMAQVIMDRFGASAFEAKRLVRTEGCYIANEVQMQAYDECGIEKYMYLATLDLRTSAVCASLDGKIFNVKDGVPGTNMPPMHPFCRSTTIEAMDEETLKRMQRRARNPVTGKNEVVPAGMNYQEWYAKYVEGNEDIIKQKTKGTVAKDSKSGKIYTNNKIISYIDNPELLGFTTHKEKYDDFIEHGVNVKPLSRGSLKGINYEDGGGYKVSGTQDGLYLQYHPEEKSHHKGAYYKLSRGKTGTKRYDMNGKLLDE